MNLFKLCFVEDPGWDLVHVRETVDLTSYFDYLVSKMIHQPVLMLCFCTLSPVLGLIRNIIVYTYFFPFPNMPI